MRKKILSNIRMAVVLQEGSIILGIVQNTIYFSLSFKTSAHGSNAQTINFWPGPEIFGLGPAHTHP